MSVLDHTRVPTAADDWSWLKSARKKDTMERKVAEGDMGMFSVIWVLLIVYLFIYFPTGWP